MNIAQLLGLQQQQPYKPKPLPGAPGMAPVEHRTQGAPQMGSLQSFLSRPGIPQGLLQAALTGLDNRAGLADVGRSFATGLQQGQSAAAMKEQRRLDAAKAEIDQAKQQQELQRQMLRNQMTQEIASGRINIDVNSPAGIAQLQNLGIDPQDYLAAQRMAAEQAHRDRQYSLDERGLALRAQANQIDAMRAQGDVAPTSPGRVVAPIMDKIARGEPITQAEQNALDIYQNLDPTERLMRQLLGPGEGNLPPAQATPQATAAPPLPPPPNPQQARRSLDELGGAAGERGVQTPHGFLPESRIQEIMQRHGKTRKEVLARYGVN